MCEVVGVGIERVARVLSPYALFCGGYIYEKEILVVIM